MRLGQAVLALAMTILLVASGCDSNSVVNNPDPPDPINMVARELYFGYDGSSRVIPAETSLWATETWVDGGSVVVTGTTYVLPVPKAEGTPLAYIHHAEQLSSGGLVINTSATLVSVWQDQTYSHPDINFWKLKVDSATSLPSVLKIEWQALDVEGNAFPFKLYYRVSTR